MQVLKSKLNLLVIAIIFACAITTLADAESISGNVSDGTGSVPLDYVYVHVERIDHGDDRDGGVDEDGNYTIYDLYPENWCVYVRFHNPYDNGYYGHATNGALEITTPGEYRVTINPGDDVYDYNFEIQVDNTPPTLNEPVVETPNPKANEPIHISIVTSDDSGFTEVRIWFKQKNPYCWFDSDPMYDYDGDGVYECDIPDWIITTAGVEYYIRAWDFANNHSSYPADDPENNPLIIPPEDIAPPDATISGQVNDIGQPMEGVRIEANREDGGHIRTFSDADGYYTAEVRVGTWHFYEASFCGYYVIAPPNSDPVFGDGDFYVVSVSEGDEITDINFTMSPDNTPPTIVNQSPEPIIGSGGSNDITFKAEITDAEAGVWHGHSANIVWRYKGQDWWDEDAMRDGDGNPRDGVYERNLWVEPGRIMEYYFHAWDRACNNGYDPDPPPPDSPPHIFFVIPGSSMSMDFYGEGTVDEVTVSSTPVQPGDLVTARGEEDDRMVGASYVDTEGHYMLHVYGDDPGTGEDEGLDPDEGIRFFINDVPAAPVDPETGEIVHPTFADMADPVNLNLEARSFKIELEQGWNKFSIQVRPVDTAIEEVLKSIEYQYEIVRTYDAVADPGNPARTYVPDMPDESDLTDIDHKHGYWIKMWESATLEVWGTGENIESTEIEMANGWSFISYLLPDPTSVVDTFGIPIGEYLEIVRCYKEGAKTYIHGPEFAIYNDLETLEPGMGYLVKTDTAGTFVYDPLNFTPTVAAPTVVQTGIHPTPINADFYGDVLIDGESAPVGTVITAYDPQGVLCGRYTVKKAGRFGFQHVYGDDRTTPIDEGAKRGDVITFYVNGQPAISDEPSVWISDGALIEINLRASKPFVPKFSMLYQNFPNPFNPETWIPYQLSKDADVTIKIYDVSGRLVRTLELGSKEAGVYLEKAKAGYWDGRNNTGESAASGVYFYSITAGDFTATKKMLVLK